MKTTKGFFRLFMIVILAIGLAGSLYFYYAKLNPKATQPHELLLKIEQTLNIINSATVTITISGSPGATLDKPAIFTITTNASNPSDLLYSVDWLNNSDEGSGITPISNTFTSNATFVHTFTTVGPKYPQFFVKDTKTGQVISKVFQVNVSKYVCGQDGVVCDL